jgi:hypothetical protein
MMLTDRILGSLVWSLPRDWPVRVLGYGPHEITAIIGGKTYTGWVYWSDRSIPGHWVYPSWHPKAGTQDEEESG